MQLEHADAHGHKERHAAAVQAAKESPTTFVPRLVTRLDVRHLVHGSGAMGKFNSRLAVLITSAVGTMWCAYVFTLLALVSFPQAIQAFLHGDLVTGVSWIAQTFLQLILLPIIIVGQNVISAAQDARAEADHETLTALHTMNVQQLTILRQQNEILDLLKGRAR